MAHLFISAAHKSSGKTTLSIGLCAAFVQRGQHVQPFKKGPDYIDPMWLSRAAGKDCFNLDFHTQSHLEILNAFGQRSEPADISIIEGNKGLYDGLDLDGSNSNAALACLLDSPVILVIDAQGMTRGIAPLILGYQAFEKGLNIAGVILNKLGGSRHESKLRAVIEHYTDVPVVGAVHRDPMLDIQERHLGLIPSNEAQAVERQINAVADVVAQQVNLDQLHEIANAAETPEHSVHAEAILPPIDVRIGIAQDTAFGFYYPDDLQAFRDAGAELVSINTLHDKQLPAIDGLFIGGGFPETQMRALQANAGLRNEIRTAIEAGLPVYAECGGLMYLSRSLQWNESRCDMVGALPLDTRMHQRPQGRGYVQLANTENSLWAVPAEQQISAHEFHYSSAENLNADTPFAYHVLRGHGVDGAQDGIIYRNVQANYSHMRNVEGNPWVEQFVDFVRKNKLSQTASHDLLFTHSTKRQHMNIITFSPAAIAQIKTNVQNSEHGSMAMRIAAAMTSDETVNYGMGFDEAKNDDVQFSYEAVNFLVSSDCMELLNGSHVDYVELEGGEHNFIFLNPNDPSYKAPKDKSVFE